jgi:hypothetical protein
MDIWLVAYSLISMNAWIASTFYHAKKTTTATKYDFISALLFILFGLFLAIRRVFSSFSYYNAQVVSILFLTIVIVWIVRSVKLLSNKINYDNHMAFCITIVISTTLLWIYWIFFVENVLFKRIENKTKKKSLYYCLFCQIYLICAASLEIFDFPPFFKLFDAHSLWHAATIPLGFFFFFFKYTLRIIIVSVVYIIFTSIITIIIKFY